MPDEQLENEEFEIEETEPEYKFDLTSIVPAEITDLHQEGNYLVGVTSTGTKFRQRIPVSKILNNRNGQFVLEDMHLHNL